MDLVKDLGWDLSDAKPCFCHSARLPGIMSVWLKNEKELMAWPCHCSFHYFTGWMTNKQTLPEGICILKEELINPNEPLIGGVCGGDISEHGFSPVFKVLGYPFPRCRWSTILASEVCSRMQSHNASLPQMQLNGWTGSCEKNYLKESECGLVLCKMNVQKLSNKSGHVEGLLKGQVNIYVIINFNFGNVISPSIHGVFMDLCNMFNRYSLNIMAP